MSDKIIHKDVNSVQISGRIVKDVTVMKVGLKEPHDRAFFDIAVNYLKGKKLVNPYYFHCIAWDNIARKLEGTKKGTNILISQGFLSHNVYTSAKTGKKYNNIQIVVDDYVEIHEQQRDMEIMEQEIEQAEEDYF